MSARVSNRRIPLADVELAWKRACKVWTDAPTLSTPEELPGSSDAVAYIDLVKRQVFFNPWFLHHHKVADSLPALLAHEMGHHLEYPHTLRVTAELELVALEFFERFPFVFLNLFYDLLINERVGRDRELRGQLLALYRATTASEPSPLFEYYFAIYEALWSADGTILKSIAPEVRERAQVFAQTFFGLSSIYEQFVFFCSTFSPHIFAAIAEDAAYEKQHPLLGDIDMPAAEDYPSDMSPGAEARRAIEQARGDHWFPESEHDTKPLGERSAFDRVARVASRPGTSGEALKHALVDRIYNSQIERILSQLSLPLLPSVSDAPIPVGLEDWEQGDEFSEIDWAASVNARATLGAVMPLRRGRIVDEDPGELPGIPKLEIYLDTSGSMPSPHSGLNAMTLAAQVLATLAIRRGSQVRGVVYSAGPFRQSEWMRSEAVARNFFYHYIGGGTDFPFGACLELARGARDVVRVVISDSDFTYNLTNHLKPLKSLKSEPAKSKKNAPPRPSVGSDFEESIRLSRRVVLLLLRVSPKAIEQLVGRAVPGLSIVEVGSDKEFGRLAGQLADTLFPVER